MDLEEPANSVKDQLSLSDCDSEMDDVNDLNDFEPTVVDETQLQTLRDAVAANPLQYDAHVALIDTLRAAERLDELKTARERMHASLPMGEDLWIAWIQDEMRTIASPKESEAVHLLFSEATSDYLSIDLWKMYVEFCLVELGDHGGTTGYLEATEKVRANMSKAMTAIGYHIPRSQEVWNLIKEFEEGLLKTENTEEQCARVKAMYQNRLAIPHADIEETYSSFSSFVTMSNNENYEKVMVAAQPTYNEGLKKYQDRNLYERQLASSFESIEAYYQYIEFEIQQKKPEILLIRTLFERAIAKHFSNPELWMDYLCFMVKHMNISTQVLSVCNRAVRNCPWSGDLWGQYMRVVELCSGTNEEVCAIFDRAINLGMLQSNFEEYFKVLVARVDHECWRLQEQSERDKKEFRSTMQQMIEMVKTVSPTGDPYYRLELRWIDLETNVMKDIDMARKLWKSLVQTHPGQSEIHVRFSEFERQAGDYKKARNILRSAADRNLDWPERIFEAWMSLERVSGSPDSLQDAYALIRQKTRELAAKRLKELAAPVTLLPKEGEKVEGKAKKGSGKDVKANAERRKNEGGSKKRKADETSIVAGHAAKGDVVVGRREKRARGVHDEQQVVPPSASRQKEKVKVAADLTVSVENLDVHVTEKQIREFFEDVGRVTNVRFDPQAKETCHVYVEFESKENAEAALTKNGKLCGSMAAVVRSGKEVGDFRSLYVSKIPSTYDSKIFRKLFNKYGEVEQVRFSYKNSERRGFAYVQYTTEAGAQAALQLDGFEIEPGRKISVAISNPGIQKSRPPRKIKPQDPEISQKREEREKNQRTDGNTRHTRHTVALYGVPEGILEEEIRELVGKSGTVKRVRWEPRAHQQRVVVEMENDVDAGNVVLHLHDTEYKGATLRVQNMMPASEQLIPTNLLPRKLQHRRIQGGSAAIKKSSERNIDQSKGSESRQQNETIKAAGENEGSKSNEDFRKMLGLK